MYIHLAAKHVENLPTFYIAATDRGRESCPLEFKVCSCACGIIILSVTRMRGMRRGEQNVSRHNSPRRRVTRMCGGPKAYFFKTFVNRGFSDVPSQVTSLGVRQLDLCVIAEPSPHPLLYGVTAEPPRTARRGLPTKLVVHCSNKLVYSANWQCDHRLGLFCSQTDGAPCKRTPSLCKTVVRCLNCTVL